MVHKFYNNVFMVKTMEHSDMVSVHILIDGEEPYIIKHVSLEVIVEATIESKKDIKKEYRHLYPDYVATNMRMSREQKD